MSKEILHKKIRDSFNLFNPYSTLPKYIEENFNHDLREYQEEALEYLIASQKSKYTSRYLLFHMATGSGKTLIMAASMLYFYKEQGYQNFWFFAPTNAIVKKTLDNLTNAHSTKFLFKRTGISIDNEIITLKVVDSFPNSPSRNTIYIVFSTIQNLHNSIKEDKENTVTLEYLKNKKVLLLGDEAHHYFSETRNDLTPKSREEKDVRSWEGTIHKILNVNKEIKMLGFSATLNLKNEYLFYKIKDMIVYQYDLTEFMNNKYTKNVTLLRSDEPDKNKMLNAVLLSQYKKHLARDNEQFLKPVLFFKANRIKDSKSAHSKFNDLISNLSSDFLKDYIKKGYAKTRNINSVFNNMFSYYDEYDMIELVREIKFDFSEKNIIDANSKEFLTDNNTRLLNTLEELSNPFRVVFAVAKLNEGWDVLNLFDIVRISEGSTKTIRETDSEAQLIGRGARYYPIVEDGEKTYKRKYDNLTTPLKNIETLHYHTINESSYVKNLEKSLKAAKIQVYEDDFEYQGAKLKSSFKRSRVFKEGKFYVNKLEPTTKDDFDKLEKYNAESFFEISMSGITEQEFGTKELIKHEEYFRELTWEVDYVYKRKAIQRNPFYAFNNISKYVPILKSIDDFLNSPNFLGNLIIYINAPSSFELNDLTPQQKLKYLAGYLKYLEMKIRNNYKKEVGTPQFEAIAFNEVIDDYYLQISKINNNISNISEKVMPRKMDNRDWFVYDYAIVNELENSMIDFFASYVDELKKNYGTVYLIRNERKIKIVEIGGSRGFMPDFLLYLEDDDITYQVFLEPKGDNLRGQDQWKEDFLLSLSEREDIEILAENKEVRILGIKFYSDTLKYKEAFRLDFTSKLLDR